MKPQDRVSLTDSSGYWEGTVTVYHEASGMCAVKWDTGMTERVHENELKLVGGTPESSLWKRLLFWTR